MSFVLILCGNAAFGDELSSLQSAIHQAESRIQSYRSAIPRITSQAESVRLQTSQAQRETQTYKVEADGYKRAYEEAEKKKGLLKADIIAILAKLNDTENTISINERISKDLAQIMIDLTGIQSESDSIMSGISVMDKEIKTVSDLHVQWINNAKSHITSKGPKFESIDSYETYKTEYQNILTAWSSYPSQSSLILKENKLRDSISQLVGKVASVQSMARQVASSNGVAAFGQMSKYDINLILMGLDDSYAILHSQLRATRQLVGDLQQSRRKLIDSLAIAWFDLAALKLHSVNLEDAVGIASEVLRAMHDPAVYAQLRSQLTSRGRISSDYLKRLLPIHAHNEANSAFQYITDMEATIGKLDLSDAFSSEITSMLKDQKVAFETYKASSKQIMDTELQIYLHERIRIVSTLSKRNEENLNDECKALAELIKNSKTPDIQSEKDFLKFRNSCS
jgi:vacuolar-type H+-ATPase subunit E/Vma4